MTITNKRNPINAFHELNGQMLLHIITANNQESPSIKASLSWHDHAHH